ncbi:MAG: ABC transporter substrate-binding protein [Lachnospiraceae bacterium]|jgi:iron complex transport system substrate-binding protein|nr:ABC transporter substrate-binding protein [Lachnospiraceae bacterium]
MITGKIARKLYSIVALALAAAMVLSSCGGGAATATTAAAPETTGAPATTAAPDTTAAPATTAAPGTTAAQETTAAPDTTAAPETTSAAPATKVIQNVDGSDIEVPTKVERVAAIFGPSYEKVVLLGAEDKIVCDGDFHIDGWPWSNVIYKRINEVPGIPNAHSNLNIEEMLDYKLDLVFNFPNPGTTEALRNAGIAVVPMASTGKVADIKATLAVYAEALGDDAPARAADYAEYYDDIVAKIAARTADIPEGEKKTVYAANQYILKGYGKGAGLTELVDMAGGLSVSRGEEGSSIETTTEQLIVWDPDYVFVDHAGSSGNDSAEVVIDGFVNDPNYKGISAVKGGNVLAVPTGVFFWDSGVQMPLYALWMAKTLYPDRFEDWDMEAELKAFYTRFFDYDLTDEEAQLILAHQDPK